MMTTKRLLDVCDFQGGTQPPKDEWINDPREGYVRMLQIRDYSQGDAKFIQYVKDTKKLHKCTKDDIMLSRYGYIGQAFIGLEGAYNVALVKVIKKAEIHTPYLLCYFQSYYFQHFLLSNVGARATIPGFNKDELENALIRIPEMCEQIEIASKITKVDELIGFHKQQLNVLDTLIKSRFVEMFGDPKINPNNYPVYQLSDFIVFLTSGSRGWAQYCSDDGTEWFITIKNVKDCHIETDNMQPINAPDNAEAKRTRVQEGDLLISITADLGRTGVVTKEIAEHGAYINQHLTCIRLKQDVLNPLYVAYLMESHAGREQFESKNQSAVKAGLNFNSINSLRLMIPPLDDQNAFVDFIKQTDKSKFEIQQSLEKLEILKKSLMQQYFG